MYYFCNKLLVMNSKTIGWRIAALINFAVVALFGTILRFQLAVPSCEVFNQKFVLDAHSHFAFYGWVTQAIYTLLYGYLSSYLKVGLKKYRIVLWLNIILAYLMLLGFWYGGYFWGTIAISVCSLMLSFAVFFMVVWDLRGVSEVSKIWFVGGLFFTLLSSLGIFSLAYIKAHHIKNNTLFFASTYYYLHFQYNGFFLFSCIGFLLNQLKKINIIIPKNLNRLIFYLMMASVVLGYGLSILWVKLPFEIYITVILAAVIGFFATVLLYYFVWSSWHLIKARWRGIRLFVFCYVAVAYSLKVLLQTASAIPMLNKFSYVYHPIIIAYLHLVLLMCVSVFLVFLILEQFIYELFRRFKLGLVLLLLSILANEIVLGLMGIFSIFGKPLIWAEQMLFVISFLVMLSVVLILRVVIKNKFNYINSFK